MAKLISTPNSGAQVTHALGYTRAVESYGHGTPGYAIRIVRDSDAELMYSGPGVETAYRHPEWDGPDHDRIVAALRTARPCQECQTCTQLGRLSPRQRLARAVEELLDLDRRLGDGPVSVRDAFDRDVTVSYIGHLARRLGWPVGFAGPPLIRDAFDGDPGRHWVLYIELGGIPGGLVSFPITFDRANSWGSRYDGDGAPVDRATVHARMEQFVAAEAAREAALPLVGPAL